MLTCTTGCKSKAERELEEAEAAAKRANDAYIKSLYDYNQLLEHKYNRERLGLD